MESRLYTSSTCYLMVALIATTISTLQGISVSSTQTREHHQQHHQQQQQQQQNSPFTYNAIHGPTVSVQTSSGILNGVKHPINIGSNSVYKFLSIPYAEAPVGALRFQRPVEIQNRANMILDATKFGKTCPQYRHLTRFISPLLNVDNEHQTSEDCLNLNVYVPTSVASTSEFETRLEPSKQLPVIVWIPGEGFDFADARQFDGSYLAHKTQSIVVTVQYRVGVLGFLQAPKLNITGNMGIYDQLMALKWVKRNIASFGGDSERVTLMGRFSGSMSISAMITAPNQTLLKPEGQMLFNRVAMLSGIAVEDWIIDSRQYEKVKQLEELAINKDYCNMEQIKNNTCLQTLPVEQLLRISDYGWRLVVDNELIGQVAPVEAIKQNQFAAELESVLIGETATEGTLCLYRHMLEDGITNYAKLIEEDKLTTNDLYDIIRYDTQSYFGYNLTQMNPIQTALESIVADSSRLGSSEQPDASGSLKLREKYLNACSSYMIKSHSHRFKRNIMARNRLGASRMDSSKKNVDVFHYELKYKPTFSLAPDYIKTAVHGDDVPLIFGLVYGQPRKDVNEADLLMTRKMMSYIGNFVHGNHPLLRQHPAIDSKHSSAARVNENETVSMDEDEINYQDGTSYAPLTAKRNWFNEGQVDVLEFNESDSNEINNNQNKAQLHNQQLVATIENGSPNDQLTTNVKDVTIIKGGAVIKGERQNVRVILVESPLGALNAPATNYLAQSISDIMEQQDSDPSQQQYDGQHLTRSQRLLELHWQQPSMDINNNNNVWMQSSKKNPMVSQVSALTNQQAPTMSLANESSFMTMLVFSSCIVILTLMSICLGLCLMIFRHNKLASNKKIQHFIASSSSSCNICDDSQGSGIDAVLANNNNNSKGGKDGDRGFSNVFAKLRNNPTNQPLCAANNITLARQQDINHPTTDMVLHHQQRVADGRTNHQDQH